MYIRRAALLLLGCLVGVAAKGYWVITKDDGHKLEDVHIQSLDDFLEFAQLDMDGYAAPLTAEGMVVDDIKEVTDGDLEAIGMTKKMHRARFLRYAKKMRVSTVAPGAAEKTQNKQEKKEKKEKKKKRKEKASPDPRGDDPRKPMEIHQYTKDEDDEEEPDLSNLSEQEVIAARWLKANAERKKHAKEDAARRKEDAGEWDEWDEISQAEQDLIVAVEDEDPEGVEAAIQAGANINRKYQISGQMTSPLMYCSLMGFDKVAEVLLKHDADMTLDHEDSGFTPIHGAAFQGQPEVIELLLAAGADATHRHEDGFVPIHRACWGNTPKHTEAVLAFLKHGVDALITAMDPNYPSSDTFEETGGLMTPLNMSGTNPMTIGLLEEWEAHGRAPEGPMGYWGEDAYLRGQHASDNDVTVRDDDDENKDEL